jgi:hypothetical protein
MMASNAITNLPCLKRCIGTAAREFSPAVFLLCMRQYGQINQVLPIVAACVNCGAVLAPADLAQQRYRANTRAIVEALRARKASQRPAADVLGHVGDYRTLGLPSWYDIRGSIPRLASNARDRELQNQRGEIRRNLIRRALGLMSGRDAFVVPTCVGPITIDDDLVTKLLNTTDSSHNQLLHCGIATIREPAEAWQDRDKVRFLRLYRIGTESSVATQIVVASPTGGYVNTIHEIDDSYRDNGGNRNSVEYRTNRKRIGTCRSLSY